MKVPYTKIKFKPFRSSITLLHLYAMSLAVVMGLLLYNANQLTSGFGQGELTTLFKLNIERRSEFGKSSIKNGWICFQVTGLNQL